MALKDSFNLSTYEFFKMNDNVLFARPVNDSSLGYHYDFGMRMVSVSYGNGVATQPFSALDRETLIEMREKLIELGGKPPELPAEAASGLMQSRNRLNP